MQFPNHVAQQAGALDQWGVHPVHGFARAVTHVLHVLPRDQNVLKRTIMQPFRDGLSFKLFHPEHVLQQLRSLVRQVLDHLDTRPLDEGHRDGTACESCQHSRVEQNRRPRLLVGCLRDQT